MSMPQAYGCIPGNLDKLASLWLRTSTVETGFAYAVPGKKLQKEIFWSCNQESLQTTLSALIYQSSG